MGKPDYKPCRCICLLHEHKKAYQPNLLKAMGLVMLVSALFAACFAYRQSNDPANALQPAESITSGENGTGTTAARAGAVGLDFRPPAYHEHEGFAGFRGYKVVSTSVTIPVDVSPIPHKYTNIKPEFDLVATRFGSTDTTLPLYGTGDGPGDGLPGAPTLLDMNLPPSHQRDWSLRGIESKVIEPKRPDSPPVFRFAGVWYPKKARNVNGTVVMIVNADKSGQIVKTELISEDPEGFDFGSALEQAVYNSIFFAPVVNGNKVPFRFQLTYHFSYYCPRESKVEILSGDMIVSVPGEE